MAYRYKMIMTMPVKNIFLSASVPLEERDPKYFESADVIAIRDAVIALPPLPDKVRLVYIKAFFFNQFVKPLYTDCHIHCHAAPPQKNCYTNLFLISIAVLGGNENMYYFFIFTLLPLLDFLKYLPYSLYILRADPLSWIVLI